MLKPNEYGVFGQNQPNSITVHLVLSPICSIPNWLILMACTWKINAQTWTFWQKKIALSIISIVLTLLLFMLVFHDPLEMEEDTWYFTLLYGGTLILGIWIYDLNPSSSEVIQPTDIEYNSKRMFLEDLPHEEN